jgi:hypothetical protein
MPGRYPVRQMPPPAPYQKDELTVHGTQARDEATRVERQVGKSAASPASSAFG